MLVRINKMARRSKGFTLVELLLVVAILAVLAFLAIPRIVDSIKQARERSCASNVHMIEEATNRFMADKVAAGAAGQDMYPWNTVATVDIQNIDLTTGGAFNTAGATPVIKAAFVDYFKSAPQCPFGKLTNDYRITIQLVGSVVKWNVYCDGDTADGTAQDFTHP